MTSSSDEDRTATPANAGGWWRDFLAQPEMSATRRDGDRRELSAVASDVGLSVEELAQILRKGPRAADEIVAVLRELGLDSEEVKVDHPHEFSTLLQVCISCAEKRACRRAILGHSVDCKLSVICENYKLIDELLLESKKDSQSNTNPR